MTAIRNDLTITIAGQDYLVRPDFETINRIEQRVGISELLTSLELGKVKISDLVWVVHAALHTSGERITFEQVGDEMVRDVPELAKQAASVIEEILKPHDRGNSIGHAEKKRPKAKKSRNR